MNHSCSGYGALPAAMCGVALLACVAVPERAPSIGASPLALAADEQIVTRHAVLVFDGSHSVGAATSFQNAKALLESFVEGMPAGDYQAAGIELGQTVFAFHGLAPFTGDSLASAARALPYLGGPTPLDVAIDRAADELAGTSGRAALVIFSDGVPTRGSTPASTLAAARALIAVHDGAVCIHTVRTGSNPSGDGLLGALASLTECGSTRLADQVRDASSLYDLERSVFLGRAATRTAVVPAPRVEPDADNDGDSVSDRLDACPGTPIGAKVNARGCWVLSGVLFDFDSARIRPETRTELDEAAVVIRANPEILLRIDAHTDARGSDVYNLSLSERRAESVRRYLIESGIDGDRLETRGWGETKPIAANDTDSGRQANRRVELSPRPIVR